MRAFGVLLVLVCRCNQIFGLKETQPLDAQQFDAPIDAPFACPAPGTPPQFSKILHQAIERNCQGYMTSPESQRAVAFCFDAGGLFGGIVDGEVDGVLQTSTLTPAGDFDWPRLTPEGNEIWVRDRGSPAKFAVFQWQSDHQWTRVRDLMITGVARDDYITAPSRAVGGKRRFLRYAFSTFKLLEYEDDGATTSGPIRSYDVNIDLGSDFINLPNLDASGLRLVFVGETPGTTYSQTFYADRASLDVPFSKAMPLPTAPVAFDPFVTPDCSRIYTSGLGSIFYAQQL